MAEEVPRPLLGAARSVWGARWHEWRGDRRVAAALLACVAVAAGGAWFRAGTTPSSAALPRSSTPVGTNRSFADASTTTSSASPVLVVDVVGAVRRGGVVRVRAGSRVVDAIAAAGGATPDADLTRLNLASLLVDGSRIGVPRLGAPAPALDPVAVSAVPSGGPSEPAAAGALLNLNAATAQQLDTLPGVGPATAAAIIKDREAHGPFRSVNDLGRVRGIGDAKLEQLRDLVTV
ncbi:MAG: competence protein ComEA [Actinomycetota bacterium]|nr:competence protein ComEA [Actinomycetota bacterium]MDQ1474851.1 competence protein ComEA [Actinomycetota bacterium]